MKRAMSLAVAMGALSTSMAFAAPGLNLYAGDCGAGAASNTVTNACVTNAGAAFVAVGSVIVPAVTKTAFVGTVAVLDVQTNRSPIEDWWRGDACRGASAYPLATDASIAGSCTGTVWDHAAPAGNNVMATYGSPGMPASRIRFVLGAVLFPADVFDFAGDGVTELVDFRWTVLNSRTVGAGSCAGCEAGACIVLIEVQFQGQQDASEADYLRIQDTAANDHISYNPAATLPNCPDAVPVRNRTWGAIKALYR